MYGELQTLKYGSTGKAVIILQCMLYDIFKDKIYITIDGEFGYETENAVQVIQHEFNITVDGIVGPAETWPVIIRKWWEGL